MKESSVLNMKDSKLNKKKSLPSKDHGANSAKYTDKKNLNIMLQVIGKIMSSI